MGPNSEDRHLGAVSEFCLFLVEKTLELLLTVLQFCTVHALGEMAVLFPVAGSFSAYSTRFLDPAWGFAMGWK